MVTAEAILHGDRDYLLGFDPSEQPVALQLGGSDPEKLAEAARIGEDFGYREVNLNVGCPSDRVQSGAFGACLMKEPSLVAQCIGAMRKTVDIDVTVKCRLGVDEQNPSETLIQFIDQVADAGCRIFIIHARKAWLKGLSPKDNRSVPPLDYELPAQIKRDRPDLQIILNGGLTSMRDALAETDRFDGVMLGREAYSNPYILAQVDQAFFGAKTPVVSREDICGRMSDYILQQVERGVRPHAITRHMIGLFHGVPGARNWRRLLSRAANDRRVDVLDEAITHIRQAS